MKSIAIAVLFLAFISCHRPHLITEPVSNKTVGYYGRTLIDNNNELVLIGAASYAEFNFDGDSCILMLKNKTYDTTDYNYVSIECDGQYRGRIKINGSFAKPYTIKAVSSSASHLLRVYKATESQNGQVILTSTIAKNARAATHPTRKKIEFIGDSHTAAMGNDTSEILCGKGKWYDQHNAYWSYAPIIARDLDADFLLSAVSGIGMYRNWNSTYPVMPDVYESAYFNTDTSQRWNFNRYIPDVVSICLGTNDFSAGDGKSARSRFDSSAYIINYLNFLGTVYTHYPKTQIVLVSSCVVAGSQADLLYACLQSIQSQSRQRFAGKPPVELFRLNVIVPKGCSYHPDIDDHKAIAAQLKPVFRRLLQK